MLKSIKRGVLSAAKGLRLLGAMKHSGWRMRRLLILCYHGFSVADEHEWNPELYMSPADFRARLCLLKDGGYNVLPLGEGLERLYKGTLPPRSVVITVDDGPYGFFRHAHPLLQEFGFPATVYLTTYYCDYNRPIFNIICTYMFWLKRGSVFEAAGVPGADGRLDLSTPDSRFQTRRALTVFVEREGYSARAKDELAARIAEILGLDYHALVSRRLAQLMSPDEVAELARAGVDFQLHTHRHRVPEDEALFRKEIADNRRRIQELTGRTATHFCYPSGVTDPQFLPWLQSEGILSATTCEPGLAAMSDDPLLLPRLIDHGGLSPLEFESWLAGLGSLLPRKKLGERYMR